MRCCNVEKLFATTHHASQLLPSVVSVAVPRRPPASDVITLDFVPQLHKLLQNWRIMTQENLLIDIQNALLPVQSLDSALGESLSSQVYWEAYA